MPRRLGPLFPQVGVQVVDEPIRVLLIEGKPYWDSKFLMRTLASDPAIALDSVVRLTDGKGRTVDFKNSVIIMTSNIGSSYLQAETMRSADDFAQASKLVMEALHGHFKPEFLNRVDDIVVFHPLGKEQLVKIIELRLEDVRRLLAERHPPARRSTGRSRHRAPGRRVDDRLRRRPREAQERWYGCPCSRLDAR